MLNIIQNDTSENQDDLNCQEILVIGGFKQSGKIGKLENYNNDVLGNKGDTFQDQILKTFLVVKV